MKVAYEWGNRIPIGIIYRNDRAPFEEHVPVLNQGPLVGRHVDRAMLKDIMDEFG
jgi:2-oxoglutarate ferredoxin oxidoreductase subunit beta